MLSFFSLFWSFSKGTKAGTSHLQVSPMNWISVWLLMMPHTLHILSYSVPFMILVLSSRPSLDLVLSMSTGSSSKKSWLILTSIAFFSLCTSDTINPSWRSFSKFAPFLIRSTSAIGKATSAKDRSVMKQSTHRWYDVKRWEVHSIRILIFLVLISNSLCLIWCDIYSCLSCICILLFYILPVQLI